MIQTTVTVNSPVLLTIQNPSGEAGQETPNDLAILLDGALVDIPVTVADVVAAPGLYNFSFTPASTGTYVIYVYGEIQARIEVVSTSLYTYLQNLQDEALGSWQWNKADGTLTMLRQDGTSLASFTVVDNLTEASRERTT